MSARPVIRRLAQLDDAPAALGAGDTGKALVWQNSTTSFVATAVASQATVDAHAALGPTGVHGITADAAAGTASLRTLGAGATQAAVGNHGHAAADVTSGTFAAARIPSVTAAMVAADVATQAELDASALLAPLLVPAAGTRNVYQPTTAVGPVVTIKGQNSTTALPSVLDLYSYRNPDIEGWSHGGGDKVLKFYNPNYTFWNPADPQAYFTATGSFYTHRDITVSGWESGAGTALHRILPPSDDASMVMIWSDVDVALQIRASTTGGQFQPPLFTTNNYLISGLDREKNYVFSLEENGMLRWGETGVAGTTSRAQMDTNLYRPTGSPNALKTDGNFYVGVAKGYFSSKVSGSPLRLMALGNDTTMLVGQPSSGCGINFWSDNYQFVNNADNLVLLQITANGLTLPPGKNIITDTTTGMKVGTATNQKLGFFNATPVVQPTSTTDLRTALINLGLVATGGASPLNLNGGLFTTSGGVRTPTVDSVSADGAFFTFQADGVGGSAILAARSAGAVCLITRGATTTPTAHIQRWQNSDASATYMSVGTGGLSVTDINIVLSANTGTKIGTATSQKLGFWNATPIVQPTAVADPTGGTIIDIECRAQLAALLSRMRTTTGVGLIAG
jgi:hypothetical protein